MSLTISAGTLLSWLATYALHSTLFLTLAWLFARSARGSQRVREAVFKTALVSGLATASLQSAWSVDSLGGRWVLPALAAAEGLQGPAALAPARPTSGSATDAPFGDPTPFAATAGRAGRLTLSEVEAPVPQATSAFDATSGTNGTGAPLRPIQAEASTTNNVERGAHWARWLLGTWAAVSLVSLALLVTAWRRLGQVLAGRRRVREGALPGLLGVLRRRGGVRRHVRLYTCPGLASPIALGTLFPRICLPERVLGLSSDMQESILAHELAHIARFDPAWLTFARALETAFFFQPLNRVVRRHMQQSAELLCDDWAVERTARPIVLARCLAEVAGWLLGERTPLACGMVAQHSAAGSALSARVSRLLNRRDKERRPRWILPSGACLIGATALLAPGFADQPRSRAAARALPGPESIEVDAIELPAPESAQVSLEHLAARLAAELDGVANALEHLRTRAARQALPDSLDARLAALEERAATLLARKERMNELMVLWQSTRSTARASLETLEISR